MSACREVSPYVEPYVDGELEPSQAALFEQHLQRCGVCQERVKLGAALRVSVRRSARGASDVSAAFEERVRAALAAERERCEQAERAKRGTPLGWGTVLPLAAAAALVLGFGVWRNTVNKPTVLGASPLSTSISESAALASADVESQLEQLVANHIRGLAPQFTQLAMVRQLEPEVGVPLRPPSLQHYGAHFLGGSMVPLRGRQAAAFSYGAAEGRRLTVYVYDAKKVPLRTALEVRVVQNAPVYVGTRHGYSIAAVERRGVGYALAADMDDRESAELIVRSVH